MAEPGTPTLDPLRVFLIVVEVGSFAAADALQSFRETPLRSGYR